jgi:hypothetical protein
MTATIASQNIDLSSGITPHIKLMVAGVHTIQLMVTDMYLVNDNRHVFS